MRLVEVIGGRAHRRLGRRRARRRSPAASATIPVRATDTPGFLVNHAGRAFGTEALRIVVGGHRERRRCGPGHGRGRGLPHGAVRAPRPHRPRRLPSGDGGDLPPVLRGAALPPVVALAAQLHAAGLLGRKTGRGFYAYRGRQGARSRRSRRAPPVDLAGLPRLGQRAPSGRRRRCAISRQRAGAAVETGSRPSDEALIVLTPFGEDATTAALAEELDPTRAVAVDCLFPSTRRRTLMRTPVTEPRHPRRRARAARRRRHARDRHPRQPRLHRAAHRRGDRQRRLRHRPAAHRRAARHRPRRRARPRLSARPLAARRRARAAPHPRHPRGHARASTATRATARAPGSSAAPLGVPLATMS